MRHILRFAAATVLFATTTPVYSAAMASQDCKAVASMANNAYRQNNFQQAEDLFKQAIALADKLPANKAPLAKAALETNLGATYVAQNKLSDAEAAYQRALKLKETSVGKNSPLFADTLEHYAALMRRQKRTQEAENAQVQAELIRLNQTTANISMTAPTATPAATTPEATEASWPVRSELANFHPGTQVTTSATRVVTLSDTDKDRLRNPNTLETVAWRGGDPTGARVQGDRPYDYERELRPLEDKYRLTPEETERVVRIVLEGGALFETSNGWLMLTANQVNPTTFGHTEVLHLAERPGATRPLYIINDGGNQLTAALIATTSSSFSRLGTEASRPETAHPTKSVPHAKKIIVMVKSFSLMPELMWEATREAQRMLRDGADVSILLTMDGVNAADRNKTGNVSMDPGRFDPDLKNQQLTTPQAALSQFIQNGGKVLVSERYARNYSLDKSPNLLAGTQLVSDDEIDRLLMDPANKVLSY